GAAFGVELSAREQQRGDSKERQTLHGTSSGGVAWVQLDHWGRPSRRSSSALADLRCSGVQLKRPCHAGGRHTDLLSLLKMAVVCASMRDSSIALFTASPSCKR